MPSHEHQSISREAEGGGGGGRRSYAEERAKMLAARERGGKPPRPLGLPRDHYGGAEWVELARTHPEVARLLGNLPRCLGELLKRPAPARKHLTFTVRVGERAGRSKRAVVRPCFDFTVTVAERDQEPVAARIRLLLRSDGAVAWEPLA